MRITYRVSITPQFHPSANPLRPLCLSLCPSNDSDVTLHSWSSPSKTIKVMATILDICHQRELGLGGHT